MRALIIGAIVVLVLVVGYFVVRQNTMTTEERRPMPDLEESNQKMIESAEKRRAGLEAAAQDKQAENTQVAQ